MTRLGTGAYYGKTTDVIETADVILSRVNYMPEHVDWHSHENAFFSFVFRGEVTEHTAKSTYRCGAGSLFFQHWGEKHFNSSTVPHSSFYVGLKQSWFQKLEKPGETLHGHFQLTHPSLKILFHRIYRETYQPDKIVALAIEEMLFHVFDLLNRQHLTGRGAPQWIYLLEEMLRDVPEEKLTLENLSQALDVHPHHICRYFKKHFHCTISDYVRQIRVERSLQLIRNSSYSLTDIAHRCGFADQSHFIRCFKAVNSITPFAYRELLRKN
jgi:AraC family transcriptional regulator